jgi:xylulokinase
MAGEKRKFNDNEKENEELNCFIGIDVGTQGAKAVLYHPQSQTIKARSSAQYDLDSSTNNTNSNNESSGGCDDDANTNTNTNTNGRAEQHPIKWIQALHQILKNLSLTINKEGYNIAGIGVSGQQHGMVALDDKYNVIRSAKLWCDVEASKEADEFSKEATEIMGTQWNIPAGFTAPKVLWMKKNEPQNWEKMKWVVLPHDYINLCLRTGIGYDCGSLSLSSPPSLLESHTLDLDGSIIPSTDAGDASGTGLLHPKSKDYVQDLAKIIDGKYFDALPMILPPRTICGTVSPHWKKAVNIDPDNTKSIPISIGSGDNMMSALGCQCVLPGNAVLSLGTSGTIFGVSDSTVETGTPVAPFCDATGKYLPLVCVMSCTGVLNSVLENWCTSPGTKMTHEEATKLAEKIPPGCNGLTFLPYIGGERTPNWPHATGALLGLTPQNMNCMSGGSPGLVYRAAMEGITFLLAEALDQMRESCGDGFNPKSLFVVGGGSKNSFWRQMFADVFQLELRFPLEPESAALGAAFQAGAAVTGIDVDQYVLKQKVDMEETVLKPTTDESTIQIYKDAFKKYKVLSKKLFVEK